MSKQKMRRITLAGAAALGLVGGSTLFVGSANAALPEATTFVYSGEAENYVVGSNVCGVEIVAAGAQGGMSSYEGGGLEFAALADPSDAPTKVPGGLGGSATATVTVTPGETLVVRVGGQGQEGTEQGGGGTGGWNGGGNGGGNAEVPEVSEGGGGGGGGGASDVRQGGDTLSNRVVVGGGGGGVGTYTDFDNAEKLNGVPGVGGNPATAGTGEPEDGETYEPAQGGGAGTATEGGIGGKGAIDNGGETPEVEGSGTAGTLGQGGNGASSLQDNPAYGGGGGGAGLYGGGGGGVGIFELDAAGGGGSSLGDASQPGVQEGDGIVTITPVTECADNGSTTTTTVTQVAPATTLPAKVTPVALPVTAQPNYTG